MKSVRQLIESAPLGTFRLQLLSDDNKSEVLSLISVGEKIVSKLSGKPRLRVRRGPKWRRVTSIADDVLLNEIELKSDSRAVKNDYHVQSISASLRLSPAHKQWYSSELPTKGGRPLLKGNDRQREIAARKVTNNRFPTLFDLILFRDVLHTSESLMQFFDLACDAIAVAKELNFIGCGDFDKRRDDQLIIGISKGLDVGASSNQLVGSHDMVFASGEAVEELSRTYQGQSSFRRTIGANVLALLLSPNGSGAMKT